MSTLRRPPQDELTSDVYDFDLRGEAKKEEERATLYKGVTVCGGGCDSCAKGDAHGVAASPKRRALRRPRCGTMPSRSWAEIGHKGPGMEAAMSSATLPGS